MREQIILFVSGDQFENTYESIKAIFGKHLAKEFNIRHVFAAPSPQINDTLVTEIDGLEFWAFPKVPPRSIKNVVANYAGYCLRFPALLKRLSAEYDLRGIIVRDDPMLAAMCYHYSKLHRISFLYQLSHLKEEENLERFRWQRGNLKSALMGMIGKWVRDRYLRKADVVLPISDQMRLTLHEMVGIPWDRMIPLPEGIEPCALPENWRKYTRSQIRHKLGIDEEAFVTTYLGTLNPYRRHEVMVEGVLAAFSQGVNIHLLLIGGPRNPEEKKFLDTLKKTPLFPDHVSITGVVPHEQVMKYLVASDCGLSLFPRTPVLINNCPIKLLEYMHAGLPVLGTAIPEQERVIAASAGGALVDFNPKSIALGIIKLSELPRQELRRMGQLGREYVISHYAFSHTSRALYSVYKDYFANEVVVE